MPRNSLYMAMMVIALVSTSLGAAETVSYTYDAKGRLVKVVRNGTANNNVQSQYKYDKANNRKNVKVSGAPS